MLGTADFFLLAAVRVLRRVGNQPSCCWVLKLGILKRRANILCKSSMEIKERRMALALSESPFPAWMASLSGAHFASKSTSEE